MRLIMENWRRFLSEAPWSDGRDFDLPAKKQPSYAKDLESNRVIVFGKNEKYSQSGATHGKASHMIKHAVEFFPDQVKSATSSTIDLINQLDQDVYVVTATGGVQAIEKSQITNGDILNTYDHINDKKLGGQTLLDIESQIYSKHIQPLVSKYDGMVDSLINSAIDISNAQIESSENLIKILSRRPVIYFKAIYWGTRKEMEYYVDTKTSAMVAYGDNGVATFYRRSEESPNKTLPLMQSLEGYASGKRTVPTDEYSLFRDYIDQQVKKTQTTDQQNAKKQQAKPKNPVDFVKVLISRNLPVDKIKDIVMKKNWKPKERAEAIKFIKSTGLW